MSTYADILNGQNPDDINGILAQLNALLKPTEGLPTGGQPAAAGMLTIPSQSAGAHGGGAGSPSASAPSSTLSDLSSYLGLAKNVSGLASLFGPSLATYASGAPADSAVSAALGNTADDGTAAAVQAANDAALGGGVSSLGAIGSGAAADAAVTGALGSVGAQTAGTAAGIEAANDAALAATDGGAAGAGAGAGGSALGAVGAYAAPIAAAAAPFLLGKFMSGRDNSSSGYYGVGGITDLANAVQQATNEYGPLSAQSTNPAQAALWNEVGSDPTNPQVQGLMQAMTDLTQLQTGVNGAFGNLSPYAQQLLNNMGYQSLTQEENDPGVLKPGDPGFVAGGGGSTRGTQRK